MTAATGYSAWDALDFDLAVLEFGEHFEREQKRTKLVSASQRKSKIPKVEAPFWTPKQLTVKFLSVPEDVLEAKARERAAKIDELAADVIAGTADWLYNPQGS